MSFLKFDIDDAKEYLYDELNFRNNRQSKYFPRENTNRPSTIFNILNDYYMVGKGEDFYLDLIQYLKDNNKLDVYK
jgi:N-glycosylase/DNA lyase